MASSTAARQVPKSSAPSPPLDLEIPGKHGILLGTGVFDHQPQPDQLVSFRNRDARIGIQHFRLRNGVVEQGGGDGVPLGGPHAGRGPAAAPEQDRNQQEYLKKVSAQSTALLHKHPRLPPYQ